MMVSFGLKLLAQGKLPDCKYNEIRCSGVLEASDISAPKAIGVSVTTKIENQSAICEFSLLPADRSNVVAAGLMENWRFMDHLQFRRAVFS